MHALFPGTFAPPSLGHLDIIQRAASQFKRVSVGIGLNTSKLQRAVFSVEERVNMLRKITQDLPNVDIVVFEGLVVDFARSSGISILIRSLRTAADFTFEYQMAIANRTMSGLETFFMMADGRYAHLSSSLIREIGMCGKSLHNFVPPIIEQEALRGCLRT